MKECDSDSMLSQQDNSVLRPVDDVFPKLSPGNRLKKCYRQPLPDDDKLLTTASKHYIELAVISKEGITRKQADEFTKKSLHGLTEEILRVRKLR